MLVRELIVGCNSEDIGFHTKNLAVLLMNSGMMEFNRSLT